MSKADAARDVLAGQARRTPEAPFLFFRDPRGHFAWWSWRRCAEVASEGEAGVGGAVPAAFLAAVLEPMPPARAELAERLAAAVAGGGERQIWLSAGPLDDDAERLAARAALVGGWAVVREPGGAIHPDTLLWARPTLVAGSADALLDLAAGIGRRAPRFGRARWLRRRLARLRQVVVSEGAPQPVGPAFATLGATVRVLSFPPHGW